MHLKRIFWLPTSFRLYFVECCLQKGIWSNWLTIQFNASNGSQEAGKEPTTIRNLLQLKINSHQGHPQFFAKYGVSSWGAPPRTGMSETIRRVGMLENLGTRLLDPSATIPPKVTSVPTKARRKNSRSTIVYVIIWFIFTYDRLCYNFDSFLYLRVGMCLGHHSKPPTLDLYNGKLSGQDLGNLQLDSCDPFVLNMQSPAEVLRPITKVINITVDSLFYGVLTSFRSVVTSDRVQSIGGDRTGADAWAASARIWPQVRFVQEKQFFWKRTSYFVENFLLFPSGQCRGTEAGSNVMWSFVFRIRQDVSFHAAEMTAAGVATANPRWSPRQLSSCRADDVWSLRTCVILDEFATRESGQLKAWDWSQWWGFMELGVSGGAVFVIVLLLLHLLRSKPALQWWVPLF